VAPAPPAPKAAAAADAAAATAPRVTSAVFPLLAMSPLFQLVRVLFPDFLLQIDRMMPIADEDVSAVIKTKWTELPVDQWGSCLGLLRDSPLMARLPNLVDLRDLADDVEFKVQELAFRHPAADPLKGRDDYLAAIVAYTYDAHSGASRQLYFQLNSMLRMRGVAERTQLVEVWGPFMHYMMKALALLPDVKATCYRGYPDWAQVSQHYGVGAPIQ
jgi:hypothetical protein